jgi:hypothetical protein
MSISNNCLKKDLVGIVKQDFQKLIYQHLTELIIILVIQKITYDYHAYTVMLQELIGMIKYLD